MRPFATPRQLIERDGAGALVTVVAARRVDRRARPARAWCVTRDGAITGTIGGGTLEWRGDRRAARLLARAARTRCELDARSRSARRSASAAAASDAACRGVRRGARWRCAHDAWRRRRRRGPFVDATAVAPRQPDRAHAGRRPADGPGLVDLRRRRPSIERFGEALRPLLLFGAGHVGRALVLALAPLPFAVDLGRRSGPELFPAAVPRDGATRDGGRSADRLAPAPRRRASCSSMTHSHALDLRIVACGARGGPLRLRRRSSAARRSARASRGGCGSRASACGDRGAGRARSASGGIRRSSRR